MSRRKPTVRNLTATILDSLAHDREFQQFIRNSIDQRVENIIMSAPPEDLARILASDIATLTHLVDMSTRASITLTMIRDSLFKTIYVHVLSSLRLPTPNQE